MTAVKSAAYKKVTSEENEKKLKETTERKVNEMKNRKWIVALLTFVLLMFVTLTGVLAEEEAIQIKEQPELVENLPAELAEEPAPEKEELPPEFEMTPDEDVMIFAEVTAPVMDEEFILPEPVVLAQTPEEVQGEEADNGVDPNWKNGTEGLHPEYTVTEHNADWALNAGVHKNDAESGRDVDVNLLHFHSGDGFGAGAFALEAPDGSIHAGAGVHAGMDMELTLVEVKGAARLGDKNNNIHATTEVDLGEAKAAAEFTVGTVDGNLVVGLNGNMEADLVEAKIGGGVTVGGVEIGGHVGGKLGVGAKLNVGYKDGKFKADVGAALGIGIEVGVEIDVGAAAEKVQEVAKDVTLKAITSDTGMGIIKTAAKVGSWITGWFK